MRRRRHLDRGDDVRAVRGSRFRATRAQPGPSPLAEAGSTRRIGDSSTRARTFSGCFAAIDERNGSTLAVPEQHRPLDCELPPAGRATPPTTAAQNSGGCAEPVDPPTDRGRDASRAAHPSRSVPPADLESRASGRRSRGPHAAGRSCPEERSGQRCVWFRAVVRRC